MPAQDSTGPMGSGPKTGRGMGPCNSDSPRTFFGRGRGFMRGRCCFGCGFISLDEQEVALEKELEAVREEKKERNKK